MCSIEQREEEGESKGVHPHIVFGKNTKQNPKTFKNLKSYTSVRSRVHVLLPRTGNHMQNLFMENIIWNCAIFTKLIMVMFTVRDLPYGRWALWAAQVQGKSTSYWRCSAWWS